MADLAISRKGREKATGKVKYQGSRLGGRMMMSKVRAQRNQRSFSCPEFSRKQGDERTDDSIGKGGGGGGGGGGSVWPTGRVCVCRRAQRR